MQRLPLVKDTVVNRRHVFEQIQRILPKPETQLNFTEVMASIAEEEGHMRIENSIRMTACFECMICESCCPRYLSGSDLFPGPLGLLFLAQRQQNPAAVPAGAAEVARVTAYCARCGKCLKYCPAESKPLPLALKLLGCQLHPYVRVSIDEKNGRVLEMQANDDL
jgi:succinate dehydrogenase/fumarate reductase-like Fe-S protein